MPSRPLAPWPAAYDSLKPLSVAAGPLPRPRSEARITESLMAKAFGRRDVLKARGAAPLLGPGLAHADDDKGVPEQIVDTMNAIFGKHPGFRSAHAKGIVCEGEFTPSPRAATLSKAPHLQDKPVRVTV